MNNSNVAFGIGFCCLVVLVGVLLFHTYTPSVSRVSKSTTKVIQKPSVKIPISNSPTAPSILIKHIQITTAPVKTNSLLTGPRVRKPTIPQAPVVNGPSCITDSYEGAGTTIDGSNVNPPIQYADISTSNNFAAFYRRNMNGSISLNGLNGFMLYPDDQKQLIVKPNTSYYIRFFNGLPDTSGYSLITEFSFKNCTS